MKFSKENEFTYFLLNYADRETLDLLVSDALKIINEKEKTDTRLKSSSYYSIFLGYFSSKINEETGDIKITDQSTF